ncbi:hypothetical protein M8818_006225 [Zalaria obscura]|uniref:Uncharacterized protein n=1 Tax=Zalaria obscura TaxID=2024903 RepID=A0ACC3SBM3_9PEZI
MSGRDETACSTKFPESDDSRERLLTGLAPCRKYPDPRSSFHVCISKSASGSPVPSAVGVSKVNVSTAHLMAASRHFCVEDLLGNVCKCRGNSNLCARCLKYSRRKA